MKPIILTIRSFRHLIHALTGTAACCRYFPTCSQYAEQAFRQFNPIQATWLSLTRLMRCHPFGSFGYDPLPKGGR